MSRHDRRFYGHRRKGRFDGPRRIRPNRPHFRKFREMAPPRPQLAPPKPPETIEVYQARGPGHLRIMGRIEFDVRNILKVADVPANETFFYLACAREMYSDFENTKPERLEEALDTTTTKWLARNVQAELVKRIRNKITDIYRALKPERLGIKPAPSSQPAPVEVEE